MAESHAQRSARLISSLKIQGASAIADFSLSCISEIIHSNKAPNASALCRELRNAQTTLENARITEPFLRNSLRQALNGIEDIARAEDLSGMKKTMLLRISAIQENMRRDHQYITDLISRKIPDKGTVFTHCHSNTVVNGIIKAWKEGKRFVVHNTEARPLYQGRKTAIQLAQHKIPIMHHTDNGAMNALLDADLALFGCDAIYTDGVANKIGTRMFCHITTQYDIPTYFCTHSLKFDQRSIEGEHPIEERDQNEVWADAPKQVRVMNPAFDITEQRYMTGIITEQGVLTHCELIAIIERKYPWLFD